MGSFLSKLCGNTKKEEDEDDKFVNDNETNAEKLTNDGSNVDVSSDKPSEPNFLRVDSLARNVETEKEVDPIQNTTNINDGENNIGAQKKKDEQNDMKTNKNKEKRDTLFSDSSWLSDSDMGSLCSKLCGDKKKKEDEEDNAVNFALVAHYLDETNVTQEEDNDRKTYKQNGKRDTSSSDTSLSSDSDMENLCSKLCGDENNEEDEADNTVNYTQVVHTCDETNAEILTNGGGTLDVCSGKPSAPNFLRDDSMARKMEKCNKGGDPIKNITNIDDGENMIGVEKTQDEQNDRKTNKKNGKRDTSSSDTSLSSDSDNDDYRRKRKKKKIQNKARRITNMNIQGTSALFTCMRVKKNPAEFLKKTNLIEDASERLAVDRWLDSVGIVVNSSGKKFTCFRVGSKYVMTALHCVRMLLKPEVITPENNWLEWQDCLHELTERRTSVDFHYLTDNEDRQSKKFFFKEVDKDSIPFFDESTDCIILELEVSERPFPPPFRQFGLPKLEHKFTLIHHAGGQTKKVEHVSKILNMDAPQTSADSLKLSELSEQFLIANGQDVTRFQCEVPPYNILKNRSRILFHCQCNKGASGSPGLQVQSDKTVVVVTMLLNGYPDWYYSAECVDIKDNWDKSHTIQQGANMSHVWGEIRCKNFPLFNDMFVPVSRRFEPVLP